MKTRTLGAFFGILLMSLAVLVHAGYMGQTYGVDPTGSDGSASLTSCASCTSVQLFAPSVRANTYQPLVVVADVVLQSQTECANIAAASCPGTCTWTLIGTSSRTGICQSVYYHIGDSNAYNLYGFGWTNAVKADVWMGLLTNVAITSPIDTTSGTSGAGGTTFAMPSITTGVHGAYYMGFAGVSADETTWSLNGVDPLLGLLHKKNFAGIGGANVGVVGRFYGQAGSVASNESVIGNTAASNWVTTAVTFKPLYIPPFMTPTVTAADGTHCGSGATAQGSGVDNSFKVVMGSTNPTTACDVTFNFPVALSTAPKCTAFDVTKGRALRQTALNTTHFSFALGLAAECTGANVSYGCCTAAGVGATCDTTMNGDTIVGECKPVASN